MTDDNDDTTERPPTAGLDEFTCGACDYSFWADSDTIVCVRCGVSGQLATNRTRTGQLLTDADIEALAEEAERGYDVERLAKRPGRPRIGTAPAVVVPVRLPPELHDAVKSLADTERTSVSELVRVALRAYLAGENG